MSEVPSKESLIKSSGDFKVLPLVARKIIELLQSENTSALDISDVLEKDQLITAKVLRMSNSAFFGARSEVTSLRQAIVMLGFNAIKDIVMTVSTKSLNKSFGMTEQMMWNHSVGTAIGARVIGKRVSKEIEELAFIGGLMHDFGKIVMNNASPQIYAEVMMAVYNEGVEAIGAEMKLFGYDHAEIGSEVLQQWGFPEIYVVILADHHLHRRELSDIEDEFTAKGVACINLANNVSRRLGIGFSNPDGSIMPHELPSAQMLGFDEEAMESIIDEINETYATELENFQ